MPQPTKAIPAIFKGSTVRPREYHHAEAFWEAFENLPKQGGGPLEKFECKLAAELLPLASAYEAECGAALAATSYEAKVDAASHAE